MSISPFAQQPLTEEFLNAVRRQLVAQNEAIQREEFTQLYDFYCGGRLTAQDKYILKDLREREEAWLNRVKRGVGVNICKPLVRCIADALYGGEVMRHLRRPGAQTSQGVTREDKALQELIRLSEYDLMMKRVASDASIFGTDIRGPWFDPTRKIVRFRNRYIGTVVPAPSMWDSSDLDALMIEYETADPISGETAAYVEMYTPWEIAFFRAESLEAKYFKLIPASELPIDMKTNPWPNRYGLIPWVKFTAEPDPDEGIWYGISDLRDAAEINRCVNQFMSVLDKNVHDQGWSQLVLVNFPDSVMELDTGTLNAIRVGEGGDAKYIIPDLKTQEVLQLIDKLTTLALEGANVPKAALRTYSEPKSGVSLELELKPLIDLAEDRRRRWRETEAELLKMALLMREVHVHGASFTPETAAQWMAQWDVSVEWRDDLMPHDKDKEVQRDLALMREGVLDPLYLVEKYNELGGKTPEQKLEEIKTRMSMLPDVRSDKPAAVPQAGETPDGRP